MPLKVCLLAATGLGAVIEKETYALMLAEDPAELVSAGAATQQAGSQCASVTLPPSLVCRILQADVPYAAAKRALDVLLSLTVLALFSWLFALIALAVRLTSRGPVIFKQRRVGHGGRIFTCYKFRSMTVDAEETRHRLLHLNEATGPTFKLRNDPRITRIGRWLRRFSLDELPQFYNVLRGDMSIVGPRPPLPSEVLCYTQRELGRLAVKPGLTCFWQVQGRNHIPFDHWVELDLLYIGSMSLRQDLAIILQTIPAVLGGRGAM